MKIFMEIHVLRHPTQTMTINPRPKFKDRRYFEEITKSDETCPKVERS
jgi:hypothetical protein